MRFAKRPWGFWIVLLQRKHFKVKLLRFKRGGCLSLQRHQNRAELWLFLSGYGNMEWNTPPVAGDFKMIRRHSWHRYEAKEVTWVLEIQYGQECVETDIERANG